MEASHTPVSVPDNWWFLAEALKGAQLASSILFNSSKLQNELVSLSQVDADALLHAIGDHPRLRHTKAENVIDVPVTRVVVNFGLVPSHGMFRIEWNGLLADSHPAKAKALLQAGGLYLNNGRVDSLDRKLGEEDFIEGRVAILRAGREEHLILELL